MSNNQLKTMRDAFIEAVYERMGENRSIFFLSADLGAPALDRLRRDFKDRFINVGIAEQNLINIAAGLALEGYIVYAYAIAPFITMRAYEQIRQSLSISSQIKPLNVNLVGVGAGLSYELSGPSHHCLEDISIMKLLPNFMVFSPSDWKLAKHFVDYSVNVKMPKYLRFDGRPLPVIYEKINPVRDYKGKKGIQGEQISNGVNNTILERGFCELSKGKKVCLVSTGFMTHRALKVAKEFQNIGVIDVFILKPLSENLLFRTLKKYKYIITIEEGFINNGGLDSLIFKILRDHQSNIKFKNLGFNDKHIFEVGDRDYLHKLNGLDEVSIIKTIKNLN